jgi:hypothetical protein
MPANCSVARDRLTGILLEQVVEKEPSVGRRRLEHFVVLAFGLVDPVDDDDDVEQLRVEGLRTNGPERGCKGLWPLVRGDDQSQPRLVRRHRASLILGQQNIGGRPVGRSDNAPARAVSARAVECDALDGMHTLPARPSPSSFAGLARVLISIPPVSSYALQEAHGEGALGGRRNNMAEKWLGATRVGAGKSRLDPNLIVDIAAGRQGGGEHRLVGADPGTAGR